MNVSFPTSKSAIGALNLSAAAIFTAVIATSALTVTRYVKDGADSDVGTIETAQTVRPSKVQIDKIVGAHLFGKLQTKPQPVQQVVAPKTRLNLSLTGIIASDDPLFARAIITSGNRPAKSYAIGDVLEQSNVKLHEIKAHMVLLDREGKLESLAIVQKSLKASGLDTAESDTTPLPEPSKVPSAQGDRAPVPEMRERIKNLEQGLQRLGNAARPS